MDGCRCCIAKKGEMVLILVERVTFINEKKKGRVKFTESRKFLETFNVKQNGRFKRDTRWQ